MYTTCREMRMEDGYRTFMYAYTFVKRRCDRSIVERYRPRDLFYFSVGSFVWKALAILIRLAAGSHVNASLFKSLSCGTIGLVTATPGPLRGLGTDAFYRPLECLSAFTLYLCACGVDVDLFCSDIVTNGFYIARTGLGAFGEGWEEKGEDVDWFLYNRLWAVGVFSLIEDIGLEPTEEVRVLQRLAFFVVAFPCAGVS